MKEKSYVDLAKKKISKISSFIKLQSLSIVLIKKYHLQNGIFSTISHIYETDIGKKSFEHYLNSSIKAVLDQDANRKVENVRFYEEEKLFFVSNDKDGKIVFHEVDEQNIFAFIEPSIENYFNFMLFPIVECDEFFVDNAGFSNLKKINNIVGLGFLLTYDYAF